MKRGENSVEDRSVRP